MFGKGCVRNFNSWVRYHNNTGSTFEWAPQIPQHRISHSKQIFCKDDSSLVQLFIMLHRPVNFEISAVACTSQQANLKKQWSMKYYKQLNGKAIIFTNRRTDRREGGNSGLDGELTKIWQFQSWELLFEVKYQLNLPENDFVFKILN